MNIRSLLIKRVGRSKFVFDPCAQPGHATVGDDFPGRRLSERANLCHCIPRSGFQKGSAIHDPVQGHGSCFLNPPCRRIGERLKERNITRTVTSCPNCRKIPAVLLSGIHVEFVLDLLYEETMPNRIPEAVFLRHPCQAMEFERTHKTIAERIGNHRRGETMPSLTACCGSGGGVRPPLLGKREERPSSSLCLPRSPSRRTAGFPIAACGTGCSSRRDCT
jgi:hypothetical protein